MPNENVVLEIFNNSNLNLLKFFTTVRSVHGRIRATNPNNSIHHDPLKHITTESTQIILASSQYYITS